MLWIYALPIGIPLLVIAITIVPRLIPIRRLFAGVFPKKDTEYKKITNKNFEIKGTVLVKYLGVNMDLYDNGDNEYRHIEIPQGITEIGKGAFNDEGVSSDKKFSWDIHSVLIPEGVTVIGAWAFAGLHRLERVEIPKSVTTIREYAFMTTNSLESVKIPSGVTTIGAYAFLRHPDNIPTDSSSETSRGGGYLFGVRLPASVRFIETKAFADTQISSIKIPAGVTVIKDGTFRSTPLKSVKIPSSVTVIGEGAFAGCWLLPSVSIPESVESIEKQAFAGCKKLRGVELSRRTKVKEDAFSDCPRLDLRYRD